MIRAAILRHRHADHLGDERHRARRPRIDFEHVDLAVLDGVLHVHQPDHVEAERQFAGLPLQFGNIAASSECGGSEQAESPE